MVDIAIVGQGPAGLSAAINAAARNKDAVVFGKSLETSGLYKAERVDNYLGMRGLSGARLLDEYALHAEAAGVKIIGKRVQQIMPMPGADGEKGYFSLNVDNDIYEAKTIILATGLHKAKKLIPGEEQFLGKGVSYCATCDGMFYRNAVVCVVAEDKDAIADANFLSEICQQVIVFLGKGCDAAALNDKVLIKNEPVQEIVGEQTVTAVVTEKETISCKGVFIMRESIPITSLIHGLAFSEGKITVNRSMETNMQGVYAAGDCTGRPYQVAKAIGEGLVAALSAVQYLDS